MSDPPIFRYLMIAGFVLLVPIMVTFRLRSQATHEPLDRRQEGFFILATLRPLGIAHMLGMMTYMANPEAMAWSALALPDWLRWIGILFGVLAGALLLWTLRNLGKNLTDTVVTRKEHTLVTSGPYRYVRHPFYDVTALATLANGLAAANWFLLATGALVFTLMLIRTKKEEENLVARFGDDYRRYIETTGRFLPRKPQSQTRQTTENG